MERLIEYAGHHPWLLAAAIFAAVAVIAFELRHQRHTSNGMGPQELVRAMNSGALVLDLRKAEDFAAGHISGARNFNPAEILTAGESLRKYKEKTVIAYCESGSLSGSAARQLTAQGFTKAFNLRGGLAAWRSDNLPLAKAAIGKGKA
jgi:rhodanese-related sulfurtransferase